MCFHKHSEHPIVKTAGRTIVCYKRLTSSHDGKVLFSPYQNSQYKIGEVRKMEYNFASKPFIKNSSTFRMRKNEINKGLHSYSEHSKALWNKSSSESIYKCYIPKGAKYWYNPDRQEYVATQLIVKEKI